MKQKESNIKELMKYAKKYKFFTYSSWTLSVISAFIALVPYVYIWKIIKEVMEKNTDNIIHYGIMALIFAIIYILIYMGALLCSHLGAFRVATNIKKTLLEHITKLPLGVIDDLGSGKVRKTINETSSATETYLAHQLPDKASALATPIGLIILLFVFDWRLGILSLVPVILGFVIMSTMTGKKMATKMKEYNNALDDMSNEAVEYVRGIPVVKVFAQTIYSFKKFKSSIDNYQKWVISYTKDLRMPMMFYTTAINSVFAFLIAGGYFFIVNGSLTDLINLIFYVIITPIISVTLTKIMYMSENQMIVRDALNRINDILNIQPLPQVKNEANIKDYNVILKNVSYSYTKERKAINNISLTVNQNTIVALVGPSGSGKTTIASLISRFFDIDEGSITIGGVNIKEIPKNQLMNTVSYIFQDSHLLKMSILDNVKIGKKDATDSEVLEALKIAQCEDIINKFPNGIYTMIGSKGVYLSGGEQQRIALARIIINDAPIIVLDEATAYADPDNEVKIQKAINNISKNKTVIMIAHRLSTIKNVDNIFVLEDGKLIEFGSHEKLVEQGGKYSKMWQDYNNSVNWKIEKEVKNG